MQIGMWTVKAHEVLDRNEDRAGKGLEAIYITFWQGIHQPFAHVRQLCEAEFKDGSLIWQGKVQPNVQNVAWVLLAVFSQI